jgi:hypothetical protein
MTTQKSSKKYVQSYLKAERAYFINTSELKFLFLKENDKEYIAVRLLLKF